MPQFTSPRGQNPDALDSEVVYDDRRAVLVEDHGLLTAEVQGTVITIVWPVGNTSNANIFVNGEKVAAGLPAKTAKEQKAVRGTADEIIAALHVAEEDEVVSEDN